MLRAPSPTPRAFRNASPAFAVLFARNPGSYFALCVPLVQQLAQRAVSSAVFAALADFSRMKANRAAMRVCKAVRSIWMGSQCARRAQSDLPGWCLYLLHFGTSMCLLACFAVFSNETGQRVCLPCPIGRHSATGGLPGSSLVKIAK